MTILPNFGLVFPEIFLALLAMGLLIFGAFKGESVWRTAMHLAAFGLIIFALWQTAFMGGREIGFSGLFIQDDFAIYAKILIAVAGALALWISLDYLARENLTRPEYAVLVLFAVLGMMLMVSANDLMSLYMGLELQSLSLYVLAALQRDNLRSSEAGLKYFVLGAMSSGLYLYGASLLYGYTGATDFTLIAAKLTGPELALPALLGLVFIAAALAFKISAAPFHMWTPDVYEGAPTSVSAFFAAAPKIAALCLLVRVLTGPFADHIDAWRQIIVVIAVLSMVIGAFAAIAQQNIKRLMAYSAIGHIGFALVGLAAASDNGIRALLLYITIYLFMTLGSFAIILSMRVGGRAVERLEDLAGLSRAHPVLALSLILLMFSMAGVPPLAGFFGKYAIFQAAIEQKLYSLAVIGVLTSVVSAYYYLRILKYVYFDTAHHVMDKNTSPAWRLSLLLCVGFTGGFFFCLNLVTNWAAIASYSVLHGH
jgi:NADH-quinone oxidoreductase subunit N